MRKNCEDGSIQRFHTLHSNGNLLTYGLLLPRMLLALKNFTPKNKMKQNRSSVNESAHSNKSFAEGMTSLILLTKNSKINKNH